MRRLIIVVLLGIVSLGAGLSVPKVTGGDQGRHVDVSAPVSCVCYCKSTKYYPGAVACMGGFQMQCRDRNGDGRNCGWDSVKDSNNNYIRCNGEC